MSASRQALLAVLSRKGRRPKDQNRIEERIPLGICINKFAVTPGSSESRDCERKHTRRGLCTSCYTSFDRMLQSLRADHERASEYELEKILEGVLLQEQEIRILKQTNRLKSRLVKESNMVSKTSKANCLTPDCKHKQVSTRGLCSACLSQARALILCGMTTWEELESMKCTVVPKSKLTPFPAHFEAKLAALEKKKTKPEIAIRKQA